MTLFLLLAVAVLAWFLWRERRRYDDLEASITTLLDEARKDALKRSRDTRRGQVAEQMVPWLPDFAYNPKDARFLGAPVDFVVFDGLDAGDVKRVVLVEVKCGDGAKLNGRQRDVRRCVEEGRVSFEVVQVELEEMSLSA